MTPQWVTTETTSKIPLKGLFVVVDVKDHTTTLQTSRVSSRTEDSKRQFNGYRSTDSYDSEPIPLNK